MASFYDDASLVLIPSGKKAGKLYSQKPTDGLGDMTFTRTGDTATRVNSNGLIETVLANVPRIDYTGGGCGKLLLEPQKTNLLKYSERFDNSNWNKLAVAGAIAPIVTPNIAISPDGTTNADRVVFFVNSSDGRSQISQDITATGINSGSVWIKAVNSIDVGKVIGIRFTNSSYSLIAISDKWQRVSITATALNSFDIELRPLVGTSTGEVSIYLYGAQLEVGDYVSSYIPTLGALVTRGADICSKTGISSLIGQTEGTLFVEINLNTNNQQTTLAELTNGTSNISLIKTITNTIIAQNNGSPSFTSSVLNSGNYKIAFAYKLNDFAFYINGSLINSSLLGNPITADSYSFGSANLVSNINGSDLIKKSLIFKTRLSNNQLAELTTL